jgi:lysophospholipase L1-like esterase
MLGLFFIIIIWVTLKSKMYAFAYILPRNSGGMCTSQLRKDYGKDEADVIMNIVGNVISGQVMGDTAKQLSERIGKIMQDRQSLSINSGDTSISKSK